MAKLALGALGIVYGDIGTSPLYAYREAFEGHDLEVNPTGVIGASSLVIWALIIVISVKYLALVMRADNKGEGGILALTALLGRSVPSKAFMFLTTLGIFGTALLYGDGMITPAISVLSAVEGLEGGRTGSASLGHPASRSPSSPYCSWFSGVGPAASARCSARSWWCGSSTLAVLGLRQVVQEPQVLRGLEPALRHRLLPGVHLQRLPGARIDLPGGHRRRGAVRRHGPLRTQARSSSAGSPSSSRLWC